MTEPRHGETTTHWDAQRLRERYAWLNRFSDEELSEISYCEVGDELSAGEQYFDVNRPEQGIIVARVGDRVPKESCVITRSRVSPTTWAKLTAPLR